MADDKDDAPAGDLAALMKAVADAQENLRIGDEIQFPIEVHKIRQGQRGRPSLVEVGQWVAVRLAGKQDTKTYLGIYLGDLVASSEVAYHVVEKELRVVHMPNPAMYVPDLKRVVWGMESWWGPIRKPEDLKQITDQDIENTWYVKALREMESKAQKASAEKPS